MKEKELVRAYVEAANALRTIADIEIGFALVDLMREMPVKASYALLSLPRIYSEQVKDRLPEE